MSRNLSGLVFGRGWWKGKTFPESYRRKISDAHKGKRHSDETKKKMSEAHKGVVISQAQRKAISLAHKGKIRNPWTEESRKKLSVAIRRLVAEGKHNMYIADRSKLKRYGDDAKDRRSYAYTNWRKEVWLRDNFKCKIANVDCDGRIEAHHISGWSEHPELRYEINNGITLCHAHHPRKKVDERRMSEHFRELIQEMTTNTAQ